MPGEGQNSSQGYCVAVKVTGYDAELKLGTMKAVFWSEDVSKVKSYLMQSSDNSLILYPRPFKHEPDPKVTHHIPKGLDKELDRQVDGHRVSQPRSLEEAASSLQERPPGHRVENEPEPRPDIEVDMTELAEYQRQLDQEPEL
jgi:hypothetical protein